MLVFYKGEWRTVNLPEYTDVSWTYFQRMQAAHLVLKGLQWSQIEQIIYR
jgi:hypothetical protein